MMLRMLLCPAAIAIFVSCASDDSGRQADSESGDDVDDTGTAEDPDDTHPADAQSADSADSTDSEPSEDSEVSSPEVIVGPPCWPDYSEARCGEEGWTWHADLATHYCPNPGENCPPPTTSYFCALGCEEDVDCEGTTTPYCGRIGYWGGSDSYGCSPFKVCVPFEIGYEWDCYSPRPAEVCPG